MKKPIQQVRGAVLVMAALVMVLLIGVAALALDMGRLYVLHTEMQNAVDAAVLSAAVELDGEAGALDMAKAAANQEMLNHLAHFSKQDALLENLQAEDSVFTFYSWIGSDMDSSTPPSDCAPVDGKCVTTSDDEASYVQIELDPVLLATDDDRYEIDLYFLPVLSLFGVDTATEASTRVVALAGSHTEVCNYPPMFICDPSEGGDPLVPGQMVALKEQGPGAPWVAGTFGWLIADEVSADPLDDGLSVNKLLSHRLGSKYGQECSNPIIEINPGNIANWPRWGLNTRFGLYERPEHRNDTFPSAPNVVDYPRDDLTDTGLPVTDNSGGYCEDFTYVKFGNTDWLTTEAGCEDQPSTFGEADYIANYHGGADPGKKSRLEYYNWELSTGNLPDNTMTAADLHDYEEQCVDGSNTRCRMLDGDPNNLPDVPDTIDDDDSDKRRELFVAAIACVANDVGSNTIINVTEVDGKWMRFFMTEHVSPPPGAGGVTVYAEFIEEVTDKEDEHFRKVIQLYE